MRTTARSQDTRAGPVPPRLKQQVPESKQVQGQPPRRCPTLDAPRAHRRPAASRGARGASMSVRGGRQYLLENVGGPFHLVHRADRDARVREQRREGPADENALLGAGVLEATDLTVDRDHQEISVRLADL